MKYLFLLFYGSLLTIGLQPRQGCNVSQLPDKNISQPISEITTFPESWEGVYQGNLEIYGATGLQQSITMKLEIAPLKDTDRSIWAITYGPDSVAGRRSYELVTVDSARGHYQIDEKNSIVLDAFLRGDIFTSRFSVMGNLLDCTYEKAGDEIVFTIIMGKETTVDTGGGVMKGDTIPMVQGYPVAVVQRGRLRR